MNKRSGLSLLEILIVVTVSIGIVVVLVNFLDIIVRTQQVLNQKLSTQGDLAQIFARVAPDIRSAANSASGAYPIESAGTSSLIFYADVDADGFAERVRYAIGTSTLVRGLIRPTGTPMTYATSSEMVEIFISGISGASSSFEYYGDNFTGTESPLTYPLDPVEIRVVKLNIGVIGPAGRTVIGSTIMMLRGTKTN